MDATTHVHIADTRCCRHVLSLDISYETSGDHRIWLEFRPHNSPKANPKYLIFTGEQWELLKDGVREIDKAVSQLRDKELIFDFGKPNHTPLADRPQRDAVRIISHMVEKMTAAGPIQKECRTLAEIEEFARIA